MSWCVCHVAPADSSSLSACGCSCCPEAAGEELGKYIAIMYLWLLSLLPCFWKNDGISIVCVCVGGGGNKTFPMQPEASDVQVLWPGNDLYNVACLSPYSHFQSGVSLILLFKSSLLSFLHFRSRMLRRGWILQVIWDIRVSLPLSFPDSPLVPLGHHLPPYAPPFAPVWVLPPSPAPSSHHPRGEERRASQPL